MLEPIKKIRRPTVQDTSVKFHPHPSESDELRQLSGRLAREAAKSFFDDIQAKQEQIIDRINLLSEIENKRKEK